VTCRVCEPDLKVTVSETKRVNGKFKHYFIVENVGSAPADGIVLYRDVQVNNWYDNFGQVVATQYYHPGALDPGQKLATEIECPANNTTKFCAWASL
jgi:hypothetical protein